MSLRIRIMLVLIAVALLPLAITVGISLIRAQQALTQLGAAQLDLAANDVAGSVKEWLSRTESIAIGHSTNNQLRAYLSSETEHFDLEDIRRDYLFTDEIWLVMPGGTVVNYAVIPGRKAHVTLGESLVGRPEFEFVNRAKTTVLIELTHETITYASYIKRLDGNPGGILVEIYATNELLDLIDAAKGAVGSDSFALIQTARGKNVIGTVSTAGYLTSVVTLGIRDFVVVFAQSKKSFSGPIRLQIQTTLFLASIMALIVSIAGYISSGWIVMPIKLLLGSIAEFRKNGRLIQVDGSGQGEIGTLIGEFNRMAERVVTADELQSRNRILEATVFTLVHDIRGPANDISFSVDLAESILTPEQIEELGLTDVMTLLKQGTARQEMILTGLNQWLSASKQAVDRKPTSISELIGKLKENTPYQGEVLIVGGLPVLNVNPGTFALAMDNILRNGLKYNHSANPVVKIYWENSALVFEDNGDGFKESDFDRLTQPFQRAATDNEGSGLGLAIVRSIIEAHNYRLRATSQLQIGSKFYIETGDQA